MLEGMDGTRPLHKWHYLSQKLCCKLPFRVQKYITFYIQSDKYRGRGQDGGGVGRDSPSLRSPEFHSNYEWAAYLLHLHGGPPECLPLSESPVTRA